MYLYTGISGGEENFSIERERERERERESTERKEEGGRSKEKEKELVYPLTQSLQFRILEVMNLFLKSIVVKFESLEP